MRFVIVPVLAAALGASVIAPAMSQVSGQPVTSRAYMVEPFTPTAPVTIQGTGVRLRAEPFATNDTPVLSSGSTGLQLTVVGIVRQPDWTWYQVILRNGQKAFIRSDLTSAPMRGGAATAPVSNPVTLPQPTIPATPPVVRPPSVSPPPVSLPLPSTQPVQPQPLPPISNQPLNSGAISLTPGAAQSTPSLPPVDNGLLSVNPSAPTPRLDPVAPAITSTVAASPGQHIRAQLDAKRCWTDSSNMMDAHRLKASFALAIGPNGKLAADPRLVEPAAEPGNDPAMMVFLAKARAALRTCNALGFELPAGYAAGSEVRVDFSAR